MEKINNLKVRLTALALAASCSFVALPSVAYATVDEENLTAGYEQIDDNIEYVNSSISAIRDGNTSDDIPEIEDDSEKVQEGSILDTVVDKAKGFAGGVGEFFGDFADEVGEFFTDGNYVRFVLGGAGSAVALYALREIASTAKEVHTFVKETNGSPIEENSQKIVKSKKKKEKKEKIKKLK